MADPRQEEWVWHAVKGVPRPGVTLASERPDAPIV